ncbi:MAG: ATP-binding cassette domain-containing protein, partial [Bacilli bacterium]|nr:ATP-binding cassette domain-containing protein [Bacilli bacterium]MDD4345023.1 ATP-binding cassette domain-containing protein [Bacilli bacterium]
MNDTAITTSGLTKKYGSIIAVNDVTLKIPKGSIFGLIGRNGAGKTTMLKMFAGLAYP